MCGLHAYFMENVMLPIYDMARNTYRYKYGKILNKTQWFSREEIESIQRDNLRTIIKHAYDTVPYYHSIFKERGLLPSDIKSTDDLSKLPIMKKSDFQNNFEQLLSQDIPKKVLVPSQSGGSTSKFKFFLTKDQLSWEIAAEYRAYRWAGYARGIPCFMYWGSPIDLPKSKSLLRRILLGLERLKITDSFVMSEAVLPKYAKEMIDFNPKIVRGYASSIYLMAQHILENDIKSVRPAAVLTMSETLYDNMRETIEEAFECPVFDFYGSREIGAIAAQCEEHDQYHISSENLVLEFVRDGESVANGEKGEIIVTSLRNFGMPFIRYHLGDIGVPSDDVCNCGRGLPLMSSIEGRGVEYFVKYDESDKVTLVGPIYPEVLLTMFEVPIKDMRVIQETLDTLTIMAVKDEGYDQNHTNFIVKRFRTFLGEDIAINFEFVEAIPPLASGKRVNFISKVNPFNQ